MKTGFSNNEETQHEAKMARLTDERAAIDDTRTWRTRLSARFYSLLETDTRSDTATAALELAEAAMDLEAQMAKEMREHPEEPAPEPVPEEPKRLTPPPTLSIFNTTPAGMHPVGLETTLDNDDADDAVEAIEEEEDEVDTEYDGPTCPHGRTEEQVCWKCRRAEAPWDDADDISGDIDDVVGRTGD